MNIRENANNKINEKDKLIDIKLTTSELDGAEGIQLSFIDITEGSNGVIYHSKNSEEGDFLNYGMESDMKMQLTLPNPGEFSIKIVLDKLTSKTSQRRVVTLDDDGNALEEIVDYKEFFHNYTESLPIVLNYSETNDWL